MNHTTIILHRARSIYPTYCHDSDKASKFMSVVVGSHHWNFCENIFLTRSPVEVHLSDIGFTLSQFTRWISIQGPRRLYGEKRSVKK